MVLTRRQIQQVDLIFQHAYREGRTQLYEFEVYQILMELGLDTPRYIFVEVGQTIDEKMLRQFGKQLVLKIVSPDIAHKGKLGGVKVIDYMDPLFLKFVMEQMTAEVLSHFSAEALPKIAGFLLVEMIPHTQALGYEVLIGAKEDDAFGPVITLSKGGADAEFFAAHYDPANLFLPPLAYDQAVKMVGTLNIRHKLEQEGHPEYLELFAQAVSAISYLALEYSTAGQGSPDYILSELDVNPFVITADGRFVAIDGYAEFRVAAAGKPPLGEVNPHNLDGFFQPKGVAVIGVSADLARYSLGRDVAHLLHDMGRRDLVFINPKGGSCNWEIQSIRYIPRWINLSIQWI